MSRRTPRFVGVLSWVGMALLFVPLLAVAVSSFNADRHGQSWGGFTMAWYTKLAGDAAILEATWNTLLVASISTLIATVLGTLLAIAMHRTPWPASVRRLFDGAILLPVVTPDILFAVALVGAFGVLRQISSVWEPGYLTLVVGHATFQISFVVLVVRARLASLGPEQMEAARDLYASTWEAWRRVLLPQISGSIFAGALLAFTLSLDDFVISFFTSGPGSATLPLAIYASVRRGLSPTIHALSTVLLCATLLAILGAAAWTGLESDYRRRARVARWGLAVGALVFVGSLLSVAFLGWQARSQLASNAQRKAVTVLMYSEYIDPDMLAQFEQETGMPLRVEVYEAQEEMVAKLQAGGDALYDVVVASDVIVRQLAGLGLVSRLDKPSLPNIKNISPDFAAPPFDPSNEWSVPYLWGSTGILYRDSTLDPDSVRWNDLFEGRGPFARFVLMDEGRTMLAIALQALGKSPNSSEAGDVRDAAMLLQKAKAHPGCVGFDGSVGGANKVVGDLVNAAVVFNGDAAVRISEDPTLRYAVPREGSVVWLDNMLVTARAPNRAGAHVFLDWILRGDRGAQLANWVRYPTPNAASLPLIVPEDLEDRSVYPDSLTMKRMEFLSDPGDATRLYDEAWTAVKAD
jgi:ABC-type spermidine/putrescine transport system permease subunit II/spermidine/putrescine-binding protein